MSDVSKFGMFSAGGAVVGVGASTLAGVVGCLVLPGLVAAPLALSAAACAVGAAIVLLPFVVTISVLKMLEDSTPLFSTLMRILAPTGAWVAGVAIGAAIMGVSFAPLLLASLVGGLTVSGALAGLVIVIGIIGLLIVSALKNEVKIPEPCEMKSAPTRSDNDKVFDTNEVPASTFMCR
jgi:hypothetical protein